MEVARVKPQNISITDKRELYRCYMPFIKGGGLFLPFTAEVGTSSDSSWSTIFVILNVVDAKIKAPFSGKVVWISKAGIQKGYGLSFIQTPQTKALKEQIELAVLEFTQKKEPTYTI